MATALAIVLFGVAFGLWRRWLGGWGGHWSKPLKIAVLAVLTVAAWWPLPPVSALVPFGLLCIWFLVRGDNGGNGHPIRRYGPGGLGYLLEPYAARIPAMPWIGVKAGAYTEVGELWLGFATGAAFRWFSSTEFADVHVKALSAHLVELAGEAIQFIASLSSV
ncbi:hypothetical protein KL86APRO_20411 [uncultured Alphaproteobacteria bacterium]|uniref:Uncharacterized protein n=1 Tax=uncultured Alphaproteobacteria bacterium TaxID=91750 RepID=A0A212KKC1_9PROT|nr:hypothetical protein KL86APRO_20411 [uncultured Alphaproteobacteria bacterium]